jgi:uncharacterized protein (DUF1800 family)
MTLNPGQALIALNRFGLGGKANDLARVGGDPRGYLRAQLMKPDAVALTGHDLMSTEAVFRANRTAEEQRRREREMKTNVASAPPSDKAMAAPATNTSMHDAAATSRPPGSQVASMEPGKPAAPAPKPPEPIEQTIFRREVEARFDRLASTDTGLIERLVLFWSNHFAISIRKGQPVQVMMGAFEREAIRPHVLGSFSDMLLAVERHPAMLTYLDNNQSIGPDSRVGQASHRGLNENLGREILELHTLGVDGGYTQADVTNLARIITGWTFTSPDDDALYGGRFTFAPSRHQPGDLSLLGKTYPEAGLAQGEESLAALAHHPATAHHIATKLACHFVVDTPPPALVDRLARTLRDTGGSLAAAYAAMIEAPESWDSAAKKLRTPQEFLIAATRATGRSLPAPQLLGMLNALGQPLWSPPGPNGFPDTVAAWSSPEGIRARLEVSAQLGQQFGACINPNDLVVALYGSAVSAETRQAVAHAESRPQALALLLMSPEFQRR